MEGVRQTTRGRLVRVVQITVALGVVVAVFAGILPRIAGYSKVWDTLGDPVPALLELFADGDGSEA